MDRIYENLEKTIKHLKALHETFVNEGNFSEQSFLDYENYTENLEHFETIINTDFVDELYQQNNRQMILADFIEYIFLGRMYLNLRNRNDKENFITAVLHFVNLLMSYESITVSAEIRQHFLEELRNNIEEIGNEPLFEELFSHQGIIGLPRERTQGSRELNRYFDKLLPKTAGGLWHELLVFIFLMRIDLGHIIPLLLSQRLIGKNDHLVPPDFLVLGHDKRIYGVEVGDKKEIQSGAFSLRSSIPTATIDTRNSRTSDRCPICNKWILFCPFVISHFSNFDFNIERIEIKCLNACDLFTDDQIMNGECKYTKYSRNSTTTYEYTHHPYSDGLHYHYQCVLNAVEGEMRSLIVSNRDEIALKTHFPYYSGLEGLL